jgi:hypothetical protein
MARRQDNNTYGDKRIRNTLQDGIYHLHLSRLAPL